ncbi:TolC family protein [Chlorobium sp. N1]|uniref:TolC family protein n=1 Tax=Chlorobium sp. N1 TaxID=2491138 RepID=UPI00103BE12A|nr:TolC family protein [Chlorobium sp. N1]TCD47328.1 TolC family protein [Chlorobium sp. N1]
MTTAIRPTTPAPVRAGLKGVLISLALAAAFPGFVAAAEPPLPAPVTADTVLALPRLSLSEAMVIALEHNTDVRIARGEERIARNGVHIGNAGLLPKVSAVSALSWQDPGRGGQLTLVESTVASAQLQASYTLFDGFGTYFTFRRLKNAGALGTLRARQKIEDALMEVARAYFDAADSQEQLRTAGKGVEISEERLRRARLRAEYGQANTREVLAAEVDRNNDRVTLLNARLKSEQSLRALNVLLSLPLGERFALADTAEARPAAPLDTLRAWAHESNAAWLVKRREVRDSRFALLQSRSDHYPEIGLEAAWGLSRYAEGHEPTLEGSSPGASGSVSLSWPIFNGRQSAIKSENARIEWLNSRIAEERAASELERQLADARRAWENSRRVLGFEEKNIEAARLNFDRTRELYVLGQADATTFREAQLNLINAEKSSASSRYDLRLRELELRRLTGRLLRPVEGGADR